MTNWLRSSMAHVIFQYASVIVLCVGLFLAFLITPWFARLAALPMGDAVLRILGGSLGVLGAPAGLILWVGMFVFCFTEDRSAPPSKIVWCALFLLAAFFASAVYFFAVYRKQTAPVISA
jgi:hypothetical protein